MPNADGALNALMQEADIFKVGRRQYLVAPLSPELIDTLIIAAGASEDYNEEDVDREPSLGLSEPQITDMGSIGAPSIYATHVDQRFGHDGCGDDREYCVDEEGEVEHDDDDIDTHNDCGPYNHDARDDHFLAAARKRLGLDQPRRIEPYVHTDAAGRTWLWSPYRKPSGGAA